MSSKERNSELKIEQKFTSREQASKVGSLKPKSKVKRKSFKKTAQLGFNSHLRARNARAQARRDNR